MDKISSLENNLFSIHRNIEDNEKIISDINEKMSTFLNQNNLEVQQSFANIDMARKNAIDKTSMIKGKILSIIKKSNSSYLDIEILDSDIEVGCFDKYQDELKIKITYGESVGDIKSAENEEIYNKLLKKQISVREKLNTKKERITMDPSSFELLERNFAIVNELKHKILTLKNDKQNIIENMDKLEMIGKKEIKKAFLHINQRIKTFLKYFYKDSDIEITPDFEIQVKIASKEMNTLSSLSGGQRSLIALCLIFSMLIYKPAPFYIFDEIDAALDLNYTQHIGEIIKKEFDDSQFIVVSLKNNMFDNANKLFKVYIQDHKSKITQVK